jgi:type I restriction enzyme S subunit
MNGFKETEIGLTNWQRKKLGDILILNYGKSLAAKDRIPGSFPVYGSNGIVGFHNEAIIDKRGLIVGRKGSAGNVHFSKTPFCPIDTTFYIIEDDTDLDLVFLYYLLINLNLKRILGDVGVPGLNREMAYLEEVSYPVDIPEQRKIAYVLSTIQAAIEKQQQIIERTTELKKALMHKLFTEGLRGEPQKQTEIGPIPQSWDVVELGKYAKILNGFAFKSEDYVKKGARLVRISNVSLGFFSEKDTAYLPNDYIEKFNNFALNEGDLILALTRPIIKEGMKYCFIEKRHLPALLNQRVGKFKIVDSKLTKQYLYHIVFSKYFVDELKKMAEGSNQPNVSPTKLEKFLIPIPIYTNEQLEISTLLSGLNKKISNSKNKIERLNELFKSMLQQLMTGQIRVHELEFEKM